VGQSRALHERAANAMNAALTAGKHFYTRTAASLGICCLNSYLNNSALPTASRQSHPKLIDEKITVHDL
jgi:hypothetical protein